MYRRNIEDRLREALTDTPAVLLIGARQVGKSTLAAELAKAQSAAYLTLDDAAVLAAASADPEGFVRGLGGAAVIDEVQRAPALFPAIKAAIDRDRSAGRFLLTGSANVLLLPRVAESLAGRVEIVSLFPLSQGELRSQREQFVDLAFGDSAPRLRTTEPESRLAEWIASGGFPEANTRAPGRRRDAWFGSYLTTILQRDVRDLAHIEGLTELPRLLKLLAARSASLLNASELSRSSTIPLSTLKRYLALFETLFLVQPLPAWSSNLGKRLIKSPKLHLIDTGLAAYLLGQDAAYLAADRVALGTLLESFVVAELRKQVTWSQHGVTLHHLRSTSGSEVDIVLEDRRGRLLGVEVKASVTLTPRDLSGLRGLAETAGKRFVRGIVFYAGDEIVPFGESLHALPISALWRWY